MSAHLVHRCRFTDWQPSGIRSLAFNVLGTKLAVARHNGDIEIWALTGAVFTAPPATVPAAYTALKSQIEAHLALHPTLAQSAHWSHATAQVRPDLLHFALCAVVDVFSTLLLLYASNIFNAMFST